MEENNKNNEPLNKDFKVPKLRFPEFKEEWNTTLFLDIFMNFSTNSLSWDKLTYVDGNVKNIHYGIIHASNLPKLKSNQLPYIKNDFIPKKYTEILEGDIVIADTSEDKNDIGKSVEIDLDDNVPVISGLHTIHFRERKSITVPLFKTYYFSSNCYKKYVYKYCEGIKVFSLKPSLFKHFNFSYPSKSEQLKIVALLNAVYLKMSIIDRKISILKKYKIGLVNNWFNNDKNHVKLASLVHNKASQLLTSHISNNKGIYAVYDASGTPYKSIDFYNTEADSISIIKYGSGCGRTFIAKGKHSVLGTMVELIPNNEKNLMYLYAYTLSNSFKKICKKYIEIGTTPNLYYSDFSKADVYYPNNRDLFIIVFETLMKIEDNLYLSLNNIKLLKKYLLNTLFI